MHLGLGKALPITGLLVLITGFVATTPRAQSLKVKSVGGSRVIPTFSTADLSRTGIFYAGGKYVGEPGKEVMGGDAYVEVWVPKQIRHPYPIVYIHGAGQTATDWFETPDGRAGWAYYFAKQGYVHAEPGQRQRDVGPIPRGFAGARPIALRARARRQSHHSHRGQPGSDFHCVGQEGRFSTRPSALTISGHRPDGRPGV